MSRIRVENLEHARELSAEEQKALTGGAAYLKIADIKGESKDSRHEDELQVYSFSWG